MLFRRMRFGKNKKGITLVEMIAAVAITAILASVLSMMVVPVLNVYNRTAVKAELQEAVTARLNDVAMHLRGATMVCVTSNLGKDSDWKGSFPDITKGSAQFNGVKSYDLHFGFAWCQSQAPGHKFPELMIADWSNGDDKATCQYPDAYDPTNSANKSLPAAVKTLYGIYYDMKLESDVFLSKEISMPSKESFYFYVLKNPDNGNHSNILEIHLMARKNGIDYEGVKTIVCENLVVKSQDIKTADLTKKPLQNATVASGKTPQKYYAVWFSREI